MISIIAFLNEADTTLQVFAVFGINNLIREATKENTLLIYIILHKFTTYKLAYHYWRGCVPFSASG